MWEELTSVLALKRQVTYCHAHQPYMSIRVQNRIVNGTSTPMQSVLSNHLFYYPTPSHLNYA